MWSNGARPRPGPTGTVTVAVQANYEWITWSRARVLREPAQMRTEREAAKRLGMEYTGIRSIVEDIKHYTGLDNVRDIGRWWAKEWPKWAKWAAEQGGSVEEGAQVGRPTGRGARRRVRSVG